MTESSFRTLTEPLGLTLQQRTTTYGRPDREPAVVAGD
jgi:hypothetical protein